MKYLRKINLTNFRCFKQNEFIFQKGFNIILGDNAKGKTSLIEAIYIICMCKSFRTSQESEVIGHNDNFYTIITEFINDLKVDNVALVNNKNNKKVSLNGNQYKSLSEHIGYINVVVFSPDDLKIVKGEPKYRRKFLDVNISQSDKEYLRLLSEYNKILKERNELLKQNCFNNEENKALLKIYSEVLIVKGKEIINCRKKFINKLNLYVNTEMNNLTKGKETVKICYKPNIECNLYDNEMKKRIDFDISCQSTSIGPHKDDFSILINGYEAISYASQGQQRTISLAVKIALANMFKDDKKDTLILLDDVFGELDEHRQYDLFDSLKSNEQVFITTTSLKYIREDIQKESNIIKM